MKPHWESGFRCHGYWLETKRVGWVGLPPRIPALNSYAKTDGYGWGVVHPKTGAYIEGRCQTLRMAKKKVEVTYAKLTGTPR